MDWQITPDFPEGINFEIYQGKQSIIIARISIKELRLKGARSGEPDKIYLKDYPQESRNILKANAKS